MSDSLKGKRILVMGFGRQGRAVTQWLMGQGSRVVVNDSRSSEQLGLRKTEFPGVDFVLGGHPLAAVTGVDMVCLSGGVSPELPMLVEMRKLGIPFTNDVQLLMERCSAPVIGITGSAGKTTTTSLVGEILRRAGYQTWVGGNIGEVLIERLPEIQPDHVVVLELSSFQLELMTTSPQIAAVLNVTPNHLDRHRSMAAYTDAKANILRYQTPQDIAVLSADDPVSASLESLVEGELLEFSMRQMVPNGAFLAGKRLVLAGAASYDYVPHILLEQDDIPLRGDHNVSNVLAACAIAGSLGLAIDRPGIEPELMGEVVRGFKAVPHRLELVRELDGVQYINDSIATAPERLIAALRSFKEPLVLLIGGADKELPWEEATSLALQKSRHVVVFGKEGPKQVGEKVMKLFRLLGASGSSLTRVETLDEAVTKAAQLAEAGDVVLLSPGGTSYDAYPDFAARGEHFRKLVSEL